MAGMPINKAQHVFCIGVVLVDNRVPRPPEECRPLTYQHCFAGALDGTQFLARDARNSAWPHLVAVEGVTRERMPNLALKDPIRRTDEDFLARRCGPCQS